MVITLIEKKIKFSSYIRNQMGTSCLLIYDEIFAHFLRKPFLIYNFAPDPL
jgi:hypothetical protein